MNLMGNLFLGKKIFISHWSQEKILAEELKEFIDKELGKEVAFCYDRNLAGGEDAKKEIVRNARNSKIVILLLSPYSLNNNWIQFEAGIVAGANPKNIIIPFLIGGAKIGLLPDTVNDYWALEKDNPDKFNFTFSKQIFNKKSSDYYQKFKQGISDNADALRILEYGKYGLLSSRATRNTAFSNIVFDTEGANRVIQKVQNEKEIVSIRFKFTPRRVHPTFHWKAGIAFMNGNNETTVFHSGAHNTYSSWTIYPIRHTDPHYNYNLPAVLEAEKQVVLEVMRKKGSNEMVCIGTDTSGKKEVVLNDRGNEYWYLDHNSWDSIRCSGWCDEIHQPGQRFRLEVQEIETEYE